jgi:hypothetical protein
MFNSSFLLQVLVDDMNNQAKSLEAKFQDLNLGGAKSKTDSSETAMEIPEAGESPSAANTEKDGEEKNAVADEEDGPDIVIEEEVTESESDSEEKKPDCDTAKTAKTAKSEETSTAQAEGAQSAVSEKDKPVDKDVRAKKQADKSDTPKGNGSNRTTNKKENIQKSNTPKNTPQKKFTKLSDLCSKEFQKNAEGPIKKLFQDSGKNEGENLEQRKKKMEAIPDKLLLRTGKVRNNPKLL